jgi:hypothetical protein
MHHVQRALRHPPEPGEPGLRRDLGAHPLAAFVAEEFPVGRACRPSWKVFRPARARSVVVGELAEPCPGASPHSPDDSSAVRPELGDAAQHEQFIALGRRDGCRQRVTPLPVSATPGPERRPATQRPGAGPIGTSPPGNGLGPGVGAHSFSSAGRVQDSSSLIRGAVTRLSSRLLRAATHGEADRRRPVGRGQLGRIDFRRGHRPSVFAPGIVISPRPLGAGGPDPTGRADSSAALRSRLSVLSPPRDSTGLGQEHGVT